MPPKYKLGERSMGRLEGVDPRLVGLLQDVISSPENTFDFGITKEGGLRTYQDQFDLYKQGRQFSGKGDISNPLSWIDANVKEQKTWTMGSLHRKGRAVDLYINTPEGADWSEESFKELGGSIKKRAGELGLDVTWGGDWKEKDYGHFEIKQKLEDMLISSFKKQEKKMI